MQHTVIVIPCFNEEARLARNRFVDFARANPDHRLLFVDDGSTDRTSAVIESMGREAASGIELVRLERNQGKAEAVRRGLLEAIRSAPKYVGYFDADLATPLEALVDFERLLERDPGLEMIFGSRLKLLGWEIERHPWRHYLGRGFATCVSLILGLAVYDTQCGAKLFRVTPTLEQIVCRPFMSRWIFDVEILARLIVARSRDGGPPPDRCVLEVPLRTWRDVPGSKVKLRDAGLAAIDLARVRNFLRSADVDR